MYEGSAKSAGRMRPMSKRQRARYRYQIKVRTGGRRQLCIWRVDGGTAFPWFHLQALKNEALGEDVCAIEVYPVQAHTVNEQNYRHLWEVPEEEVPTLWV